MRGWPRRPRTAVARAPRPRARVRSRRRGAATVAGSASSAGATTPRSRSLAESPAEGRVVEDDTGASRSPDCRPRSSVARSDHTNAGSLRDRSRTGSRPRPVPTSLRCDQAPTIPHPLRGAPGDHGHRRTVPPVGVAVLPRAAVTGHRGALENRILGVGFSSIPESTMQTAPPLGLRSVGEKETVGGLALTWTLNRASAVGGAASRAATAVCVRGEIIDRPSWGLRSGVVRAGRRPTYRRRGFTRTECDRESTVLRVPCAATWARNWYRAGRKVRLNR